MNKMLIANGFSETEAAELAGCISPVTKKYKRGDIILRFSSGSKQAGFVLSGLACLYSVSADGQKNILSYYEENEILGEMLSPEYQLNAYYISAKSPCEIAFVEYEKLITCCGRLCEKHIRLIDLLLRSSVRRQQIHIDILGQRTTEGKLMYYFEYLSRLKRSSRITLPLSLSDLADYLSVDRSAMMREIKKLSSEGIISTKGRNVTILRKIV